MLVSKAKKRFLNRIFNRKILKVKSCIDFHLLTYKTFLAWVSGVILGRIGCQNLPEIKLCKNQIKWFYQKFIILSINLRLILIVFWKRLWLPYFIDFLPGNEAHKRIWLNKMGYQGKNWAYPLKLIFCQFLNFRNSRNKSSWQVSYFLSICRGS